MSFLERISELLVRQFPRYPLSFNMCLTVCLYGGVGSLRHTYHVMKRSCVSGIAASGRTDLEVAVTLVKGALWQLT